MNIFIFIFHKLLVISLLAYFVIYKHQHHPIAKNTKLKFVIIFVITIFINFFNLKNYPFVAVGDEVRDGALDAMKITTGEINDVFAYGAYNAHGLIIPSFNSLFYRIFGNSVLSYRVPGALIGTIDVLILFVIVTNLIGSTAAFWTALVLTCLPLHIFYSRTETVVIFSSLISILLLYLSIKVIEKPKSYMYLALLIGFSFNFHASVKTTALLLLPLLLIKILSFKKITKIFSSLFISFIAIIIGFGPLILRTTPEIFFNLSRFDNSSVNFYLLIGKYFESLKVFAFSPTTSHYFDHQPLITIPLFFLFVFGLIFLFKKRKNIFFLLTYLLLSIPLTNSAITDIINADHRLMPLLPIISIVLGISIFYLTRALPKYLKNIFIIASFLYVTSLAFNFYYYQNANINDVNNWREAKEYLSMHIIYLIKNNSFPNDITIYVSEYNALNFNYFHYFEQYQFFLPHKNITFLASSSLDNYSAILNTNKLTVKEVDCNNLKNLYLCPLHSTENFNIYY